VAELEPAERLDFHTEEFLPTFLVMEQPLVSAMVHEMVTGAVPPVGTERSCLFALIEAEGLSVLHESEF
jgi:hypothetical protein